MIDIFAKKDFGHEVAGGVLAKKSTLTRSTTKLKETLKMI
jgi:hypothetical protein